MDIGKFYVVLFTALLRIVKPPPTSSNSQTLEMWSSISVKTDQYMYTIMLHSVEKRNFNPKLTRAKHNREKKNKET